MYPKLPAVSRETLMLCAKQYLFLELGVPYEISYSYYYFDLRRGLGWRQWWDDQNSGQCNDFTQGKEDEEMKTLLALIFAFKKFDPTRDIDPRTIDRWVAEAVAKRMEDANP
jgi:hypothetical protein